MTNIILGNGINIQFNGLDYTNTNIIKRAINKLINGDYSDKVYTKEIYTWLKMLYEAFPYFLSGDYDKYAVLKDEIEELSKFKNRYTERTQIYEIGFEDYFLLNELHCRKNRIKNPERYYFQEFLRRLFLDSIYNNGKINQIYLNFPQAFIEYIRSYIKIFTTNYDKNIQLATGREILYLHGAFHVLDYVYDPNSFRNQLPDKPFESTPVIKGYEHVFSNALTGNSGAFKLFAGKSLGRANSALDKFAKGYKNKPEIFKDIDKWKNSDNEIVKYLYEAHKI